MKLLSILFIFALAFVAASIGILTFLQPALHAPVSIIIFSYKTHPYPVYTIVMGASIVGICIGTIMALYYRIRYGLLLAKSDKKIKELEDVLQSISKPVTALPENSLVKDCAEEK